MSQVIDVARLDVASVFQDGAEVEVRTPAGEVVGADTPSVGVVTFAGLIAGGAYEAHGRDNVPHRTHLPRKQADTQYSLRPGSTRSPDEVSSARGRTR